MLFRSAVMYTNRHTKELELAKGYIVKCAAQYRAYIFIIDLNDVIMIFIIFSYDDDRLMACNASSASATHQQEDKARQTRQNGTGTATGHAARCGHFPARRFVPCFL